MPQNASDTFFATTSSLTSITGSSNSTNIAAVNPGRKTLYVMNDTTDAVYIRFNGPASSAAFNIKIPAQQLWEIPKPPLQDAIFAACAGTGSVKTTDVS